MKKIKKLLGILLLLILTSNTYGASQVPDLCIFHKDTIQDTLSTFIFPLEEYFDLIGDKDLKGFKYCQSLSCSRGYQAIWEIQNDSLFLSKIQGCNEQMSWCDESTLTNLKLMFEDQCANNKVFAYWVSGKYRYFEGEPVPLINKQIYCKEKNVKLEKGQVKNIKNIKNIKVRRHAVAVNEESPDYILSVLKKKLRWHKLPLIEKDKWYTELEVIIKKNRRTKVNIITDTNEEFRLALEEELNRSLRRIKWYRYRQKRKKVEIKFTVRAYFDKKNHIITNIKQ